MGERSRDSLNRAKRTTTAPARGGAGGGTSWADRLLLEPVLDDGRRSNSTKAPPTSPVAGDRYIVGYNASGAWASLRGNLVTYNGTTWIAPVIPTGALTYSKKREEYLELTELLGATIAPALSPELWQTVSPAPASIKFWIPQHLVDTLGNVLDQGVVRSRTAESASWTAEEYYRYVVKAGDATIPSLAGYIATLVTDETTHASYWVFHQPREGALIYVDDVNAFYWYNGATWQLFTSGGTGGPVGTVFAAEGRQGVTGLDPTILQAAAVNTWQKIAFEYSAISNLDVCPLAFFTAGGDEFTIPRDGIWKLGYHGFYVTFTDTDPVPVCTISVSIQVNGIVKQQSVLPHLDDYEGDSAHIVAELEQGDVVTLEFKCTGADYDAEFTVNNGFNFYVHTLDGGEGAFVEHPLSQHTDVVFTSPQVGDVVQFDGTDWINGPVVATAGPHLVIGSSHSDSELVGSVTDGQILKRISSKWKNWTPVLDDASDVVITGLVSGQVLSYNGTSWVNSTIAGAINFDDLADVNMTGKANGSVPRWNVGANKYIPWSPVLSGLGDVNTAGAVPGQGLVFNGVQWVPGFPVAVVSAVYFCGQLSTTGPAAWTAISATPGAFSQVQTVVGGYYFFQPAVSGHYEMIVTGRAISFTPPNPIRYGIYLNTAATPLGIQQDFPVSPTSDVISAHACAFLSGGNKMGFAFTYSTALGSGAPMPAGIGLNISIKKIGD